MSVCVHCRTENKTREIKRIKSLGALGYYEYKSTECECCLNEWVTDEQAVCNYLSITEVQVVNLKRPYIPMKNYGKTHMGVCLDNLLNLFYKD